MSIFIYQVRERWTKYPDSRTLNHQVICQLVLFVSLQCYLVMWLTRNRHATTTLNLVPDISKNECIRPQIWTQFSLKHWSTTEVFTWVVHIKVGQKFALLKFTQSLALLIRSNFLERWMVSHSTLIHRIHCNFNTHKAHAEAEGNNVLAVT